MEHSNSNSKRNRSSHHKESGVKRKSSSKEQHHKKQVPILFGDLVPRKSTTNDGLRLFATNVLGDYHETIESIASNFPNNRLMGVDRSQPITPLPNDDLNIFDKLMKERLSSSGNHAPMPPAVASDATGNSHVKPHPLLLSRSMVSENSLPSSSASRHSKKRKKLHHQEVELQSNAVKEEHSAEHAQLNGLPKFLANSVAVGNEDERKREKRSKKLKKEHKEAAVHSNPGHHVTTSASHVTNTTSHMTIPSQNKSIVSKANKLYIDTTSLDHTDFQSIKDLINLPPFITPIHTPCHKDSPFVFPTTSSNPPQNTTVGLSSTYDHTSSRSKQELTDNQQSDQSTLAPPTQPLSSIIGNLSSSSDSDSSDSESSDSEDDTSGDERTKSGKVEITDENTSYMLEQIKQVCSNPSSLNTLTPIKTSPPLHQHPLSFSAINSTTLTSSATTATTLTTNSNHASSISTSKSSIKHSGSSKKHKTSSDSESCSSEDEDSNSSDSDDANDESMAKPSTLSILDDSENTQPFDLSTSSSVTMRQVSKPFHFEPDTPSPIEPPPTWIQPPHGSHKHLPLVRQHSFESSRQHEVGGKKRRRNSDKTHSRRKLHLSDVGPSLTEGVAHKSRWGNSMKLVIQIPLHKIPELQQKTKPQATVGPYNISSDHNSKTEHSSSRHSDRFNNNNKESEGSYHDSCYHGDSQKERRISSEYESGPSRGERATWERGGDRYAQSPSRGHRSSEHYWDYHHHDSSGHSYESRKNDGFTGKNWSNNIEHYFLRAKTLKREADAMTLPQTSGIAKALRYMESVTYFMRHAHAQEVEVNNGDSGTATTSNNNSKVFKIYNDIIKMVQYCVKIGSESKMLMSICLRCHSVLLWRMFLLKQAYVHQLQKELQDIFSSASTAKKSPSNGNFSPLPSPASVGSTASSCSGPTSNSLLNTDQTIHISKSTSSKMSEYLILTSYVHQGLELWRQAESMSQNYKDFFVSLDRKIGSVMQYSSIPHIADWIEASIQMLNRTLK